MEEKDYILTTYAGMIDYEIYKELVNVNEIGRILSNYIYLNQPITMDEELSNELRCAFKHLHKAVGIADKHVKADGEEPIRDVFSNKKIRVKNQAHEKKQLTLEEKRQRMQHEIKMANEITEYEATSDPTCLSEEAKQRVKFRLMSDIPVRAWGNIFDN